MSHENNEDSKDNEDRECPICSSIPIPTDPNRIEDGYKENIAKLLGLLHIILGEDDDNPVNDIRTVIDVAGTLGVELLTTVVKMAEDITVLKQQNKSLANLVADDLGTKTNLH